MHQHRGQQLPQEANADRRAAVRLQRSTGAAKAPPVRLVANPAGSSSSAPSPIAGRPARGGGRPRPAEVELREDVADVLLDRAVAHDQRCGDRRRSMRPSAMSAEHLALAWRQRGRAGRAGGRGPSSCATTSGSSAVPPSPTRRTASRNSRDVGDAVLQQVADAVGSPAEQLGRVALLDVLGQHEDADRRASGGGSRARRAGPRRCGSAACARRRRRGRAGGARRRPISRRRRRPRRRPPRRRRRGAG